MIQQISGISFKSTYTDALAINKQKSKISGDILSSLQEQYGRTNLSLEERLEEKGMDFFITGGSDNNVDLYIVKTKNGEIRDGSEVFIGSYNESKYFNKEDVKKKLLQNKILNFAKFVTIAAIFAGYIFGVVKKCQDVPENKALVEHVVKKISR